MTNAEAWFSISLRPQKPEGSLGRTAQDGHLVSHTAPELWNCLYVDALLLHGLQPLFDEWVYCCMWPLFEAAFLNHIAGLIP